MADNDNDDGSGEEPEEPTRPRRSPTGGGGYKSPPVEYQFKPGNPGGPGRPKGVTNLESAIRKALKKKLPVNRDGKTIEMPAVEVYAERVLEAILSKSKSISTLEFGLRMFEKYGPASLTDKDKDKLNMDFSKFSYEEMVIAQGLWTKALAGEPVYPSKHPLGPKYDRGPFEGLYHLTRAGDGHFRLHRDGEEWRPAGARNLDDL